MAANRASSIRILRAVLAESKPAVPTKRALHITGTRNSPAFSPTGQKETIASFSRKTLPDLKEECRRRTVSSSGTKNELIERLMIHDSMQSRAFSIAMKRIMKDQSPGPMERASTREFNTSRANKAVNDNSTMDFVYLPDVTDHYDPGMSQSVRMPSAPDAFERPASSRRILVSAEEAGGPEVMKPQIYTVSDPEGNNVNINGAPIVSTLQDVVDNHAVEIDPFNLTETVNRAASQLRSKMGDEAEKKASGVKSVWDGFVDDLLGEKKKIVA